MSPRRHYDPDHCTACGDFLPCGKSWLDSPEGCACTELCSMGPTCPGGMLAALPGSGCWRSETPETVAGAVVSALRDAAERLRTDAAAAWGGDSSWLTTGAHVANLAADWLDEDAAQIEARP